MLRDLDQDGSRSYIPTASAPAADGAPGRCEGGAELLLPTVRKTLGTGGHPTSGQDEARLTSYTPPVRKGVRMGHPSISGSESRRIRVGHPPTALPIEVCLGFPK